VPEERGRCRIRPRERRHRIRPSSRERERDAPSPPDPPALGRRMPDPPLGTRCGPDLLPGMRWGLDPRPHACCWARRATRRRHGRAAPPWWEGEEGGLPYVKPDPREEPAARDLPVHAVATQLMGGEKASPLWRRWAPPAPRADHLAASAADARGPSPRGAWLGCTAP
jgi:hypothetical protein